MKYTLFQIKVNDNFVPFVVCPTNTEKMRRTYDELRNNGFSPDEIFISGCDIQCCEPPLNAMNFLCKTAA